MVEEAHNLFDRKKAGKSSVNDDPWVRLSKEAAKYDMGLIYATQEVSSVDQRILSNTSNWIVAHLNSDIETRELSHYYDYSVFAADIRTAEDRGYVRMKTFSGKYIVPTQIAKFDHAMINRARSRGRPASGRRPGTGGDSLMPYEQEFAPGSATSRPRPVLRSEEAMTQLGHPCRHRRSSRDRATPYPARRLAGEVRRPSPKFTFAFDGSDLEIPAREKYPVCHGGLPEDRRCPRGPG